MVSAMGVYLIDTKNVYQINMGCVVWKSFEITQGSKDNLQPYECHGSRFDFSRDTN
jgi:hypothetical protein